MKIIKYIGKITDNYYWSLIGKLNQIRSINDLHNSILSGHWDNNIRYRSSYDKDLNKLQSRYFQDKDKWVDFIFLSDKDNSLFTPEELIYGKMRLILLLFWRDIANNLSNNTIFKLQLKLNLSYLTNEKKNNY